MTTVTQLVRKYLEEKPFIQEALSQGIINNAALALQIKPHIEKQLRKPATFSAVNMAVRRLAEQLENTTPSKAAFGTECDITLQSNLAEITIHKAEDAQKHIKELYNLIDLKRGDFLTITQGLNEIMIITNARHEKNVLRRLPARIVKKTITNLSSATIHLPEQSAETLGLFYLATRSLNWENINIVDIVSTLTEMTFIVKESDASRTFEVLKELINRN